LAARSADSGAAGTFPAALPINASTAYRATLELADREAGQRHGGLMVDIEDGRLVFFYLPLT
jgi:hypothetical protein